MSTMRAFVLSIPLLAAWAAPQAPAGSAFAAPASNDCAVFKGADADLTLLAGAIRTIGTVTSENDPTEEKHEAAQTASATLLKTSDILKNVAASVSSPSYRQTTSNFAKDTKDLGDFLGSMGADPDESVAPKAKQLIDQVDNSSSAYDQAHKEACGS